ncbi:hypothetical protein HYH02_001698 [Chlamydomonas schloesseri]|uniref:Uncharacterized protein n=1 Tax=Chlamydomonas schloesseri TaxID=2026947 RepID=A0A835WT44_9CHLO|nr:hypothetical protein HYH02_001698 [Chlamydomonas schloesseri]|eukprot:KAG2453477.1 hypothetical protein HYH02_001698 [Chlamydomonas schloesseri]
MGRLQAQDSGVRAARPITQSEVTETIEVYRSHVLSLLRPIWWAALSTPSTLWLRGLAVPPFIFFSIYMHTADGRGILPWVGGALAALVVPLLVGGFVLLQLHLIARKGTDKDLSEQKLMGYFSDQGWGKGSRFFVVTEADLARRAAKQAATASSKEVKDGEAEEVEEEAPEAEPEEKPLLASGGAGGQVLGCLGLANRSGGQGELLYFAVSPGLANAEVVEDALLTAAVAAARKAGCFDSVFIKLNCAETRLLDAVDRAGFGFPQPIRINAWFHATRLMLNVRGGRR